MPSTSASRVLNAPRDEVWAVLSDIANAQRWNTAWTRIEFTSKQTHGSETAFRAHTVGGETFDFVVSAWVVPEYIEFSPVRDAAERHGITLEAQAFHLEPEGERSTRVELIARASTHGPRGWLLGLLFWRGYQKQGLSYALESLYSVFEPEETDEREQEVTPAAD